jgi:ATP-dependent Clp protease protease subunit
MMHSKYIVTPLRMEDEEETSKDEKQEAVSPGMMKKMEKMFLKKSSLFMGRC